MPALPRIAVVGCGYWGSKHVRVLQETPRARPVLAVDSRRDRLEYIESVYSNARTSLDFEAALAPDIDGVVLATPISTHYELARAALLANKHVLVEKPMATRAEECRELIDLARRQGKVLMVGHTFEYHPAVQYLRELVSSGELGDIYYIDSARLNLGLFQRDADVLWDLGPHDLSIIFYVLQRSALSISARGSAHVLPDIADVAFGSLTFADSVRAHLHVSWLDPCKVRRVTIVGSRAMVVFNDVAVSEKVRIYDKRFTFAPTGDRYSDYQSGYHYGNVTCPPLSAAEPLQLEIVDFLHSIATGDAVRADGRSGLAVVEALEAASRSMRLQGAPESLIAVQVPAGLPPAPLSHYGSMNGHEAGQPLRA